ncbi:MAG: hypothetical protein GY771_07165 [bacterium]|nr:hypothetical protein [bacterium]
MTRRSVKDRFRIGFGRAFTNFGFKVLAFIIAVLIWAAVISGRPGERVVDIAVTVIAPGAELIIEDYSPDKVAVKITGKRRDLFLMKPDDFYVNLEPGELDTGEHLFTVTPDDVEYGGDLDVEAEEILGDGEVQVNVEKTVLATVPVVVSYNGRPRDGFFLGLPDVSPAKTTIYGPESVVSKIEAMRIEVDVAGRDTGVSAVRALTAPLPGITIVGADEVTVEIDVASGIEKEYNHIPISVMTGDTLIAETTEPRNADVILKGHPKRLGAFTRPEIYIDLDDTPDDEGNYKVRVKAGKQIKVVKTVPLYVAVSDE